MPRRFALPRTTHLRKPAEYRRVYREGSRARGEWMTVAVAPRAPEADRERGKDPGVTRMGFSIGKSVWKSAVRRNRVRRVFREAFRLERENLPPGLDLVLIGSRPRIEPGLESVRVELVQLVRKAHRRYLEKHARPAAEASAAPPAESVREEPA